ncbi:MAG: tetratricopeptide repeat protein [Roseateles sp.]|uniref:tetratricopeptide repeat protein n=1 Tax=Roseateles sp. TaxID=1971397 RepID=UPI004036504E
MALAFSMALVAMPADAQGRRAPSPEGCGETRNVYGPFDYRTANAQQRSIVENAHFTRGVETLTKGETGPFGGDIGYTLAVFPNHARAIISMDRLTQKEKSDPPKGADMTIECYFARGMAFAPDDLVFRMLYVDSLIRRNRLSDAQRFLDYVVTQAGDNPLTHFNAGMLYADMKDYAKALAQAHRVMAMGMTRTELRKRLESAGRWTEPEIEAAAAAASDTASSTPR